MARAIALRAALAMTLVLATAGMAARSDHQTTAVMWHPQTGLAGSVATSAQADLVRRPGGVSFSFQTEQLRPHHAIPCGSSSSTIRRRAAHPCSGPDVLLNPATDSQVTYGQGTSAVPLGRGSFAGSFQAGLIEGWPPGGGLWDPMTAEFQLALNDHGPKLTDFMPGMINTYRSAARRRASRPSSRHRHGRTERLVRTPASCTRWQPSSPRPRPPPGPAPGGRSRPARALSD